MMRAETWEDEYDEEITRRLEKCGFDECHLRAWGVADRPNDEPSNEALSNDFSEDQARYKDPQMNNDIKIIHHWIKDVFVEEKKGKKKSEITELQTHSDFREWRDKLTLSCLQHNPSDSLKALGKLDKIEDIPVHRIRVRNRWLA